MQFLGDWLTIFTAGCLVIMSPGPNFVLTLRNSLAHSRQAGIYTALGVTAGDLIHVICWLIGIGVIISKSILLFNLLKWLGAAYLIYLGIKSLQAKHQDNFVEEQTSSELKSWAAFKNGFLNCLLNPKVTLFLLALFTQIIRPGTPVAVQIIYGLTIVGIEFTWLAFVATVVCVAAIKRQFLSISHWFERIMGAVLIFFALRLALAKAHD
ncbi:LysE family translocator [Scytonema tolypothrichoides VB-61278]|nr:LysE family translocator [Scytonema tolypothrichoides VB-61278]